MDHQQKGLLLWTHRPTGFHRHPARTGRTTPPRTVPFLSSSLAVWGLLCVLALPLWAIQPKRWVHTTEADFESGTTDNTVTTNLGDIKLALMVEQIGPLPDQTSIIYDLQPTPDGPTYMAVGPEGGLYRYHENAIERVLDLPDEQVFSLDLTDGGQLLVAVSSPDHSRLAVLDDGELHTRVPLPGVRYIWDLLVDGPVVYMATGSDGKLLSVDLDPSGLNNDPPPVVELLDATQDNLLCLGRDHHGRIYTGSDTDGLVYRVTPAVGGRHDLFVVYDAPEPEVGTLLVMEDGTVYAGTADAMQARPGRLEVAAEVESGRPELPTGADGHPPGSEKPGDMPQVPPEPEPYHGQPLPPTPADVTPRPASPSVQPGLPADPTPPTGPLGLSRDSQAPATSNAPPSSDSAKAPPASSAPVSNQEISDRLRHMLQQQLTQTRVLFTSQTNHAVTPHPTPEEPTLQAPGPVNPSAPPGNAIYRISPDGFVTEVFRESVMILKLLADPMGNGKILIATGNEGQLHRINPTAEETTTLADLTPMQIPAMTRSPNGDVLLGTANPARLMRLSTSYAQAGSYTSPVLDAGQISLWGKMYIWGQTPTDTSLRVQTRSSNVQDPDQVTWSTWSDLQELNPDPADQPFAPRLATIMSPPARFLQYRLHLAGGPGHTPVVDRVQLTHVVPNLKPVVSAIQTEYPQVNTADTHGINAIQSSLIEALTSDTGSNDLLRIGWQATDPNGDRLLFTLEYQPSGTTRWLPLAKDLTETAFQWHTQHVPDGQYLVRITATDSPENPPDMAKTSVRLSDPVLIDNTPPVLGPVGQRLEGDVLWLAAPVRDAMSPIRDAGYSLDSGQQWHPVLPDDLIHDSTQETLTIKIEELEPGPHVVTLRASDSRGNTVHHALLFQSE